MAGAILVRALFGSIIAASLLSPPARAQDAAKVIGIYCLTGVREMGSCMRLSEGGKFEYFLSYGAYDERSEGTWKVAGNEVIVDTPAFDRKPTFAFLRTDKSESGDYDVIVLSRTGGELAGIDVMVTCDGATQAAGQTRESRFKIDCKSPPTAIGLGLRMFGLATQTIDVATHAGSNKAYVFSFDRGDLGMRAFSGWRLQIGADGSLSTTFADTPIPELKGRQLRYVREK